MVGREVFTLKENLCCRRRALSFPRCSWQNSSVCLQSFSPFWIWCEREEEYRVVVCYTFSQPELTPPPLRHPIWQRIYCFPFSRTQYIFFSHGNLVFQELWACVWTTRYSFGREQQRQSFGNLGEEYLRNSSAFFWKIQSVLTGFEVISKFSRIFHPPRCRFFSPRSELHPKHPSEKGICWMIMLLFYCLRIYMRRLLLLQYAMKHFSEMKRKICSHLILSQTAAVAQRRKRECCRLWNLIPPWSTAEFNFSSRHFTASFSLSVSSGRLCRERKAHKMGHTKF